MKKTFAIAAVTTTALTNVALADKPGAPTWDEKALKELLTDEKLVKHYGEVGYPLADELDPGWECKQGPNLYNFDLPLYKQEVAGVPFNVGLHGELNLVADSTEVGAELAVGPSLELFNETIVPVDVAFKAVTKDDGMNELSLEVRGFGQTLEMIPLTSSSTPIAGMKQFGWSIPDSLSHRINGCFPGLDCTTASWSAGAAAVGSIGGQLSWSIAHAGVEAHAALAASGFAELDIGASLKIGSDTIHPSFTANLDLIHMSFGGRGQLLPQSGGGWVAGAGTHLAFNKTMGAWVHIDLPYPFDDYTIIDLQPFEYEKDTDFSCKFENKMPKEPKDPKNPKG